MKNRIVISLTTLPNRYDLLLKTLKSLHHQYVLPNIIYLTLPEKAKRSGLSYPDPPNDIKELCHIVKIKEDYGPICKLYGALLMEQDADTVIITVDDDAIYPPDFVEKLLEKHLYHPDVAITSAGVMIGLGFPFFAINTTIREVTKWNGVLGFDIGPNGRQVDIVQGNSGCLYKRSFFCTKDKLYNKLLTYTKDEDVFKSDDILISGYLCKHNVKIYTFNDMPLIDLDYDSPDALSGDLWKMVKTFRNALNKLKTLGFFPCFSHMKINDSCLFKVSIFILIVFIGIMFFCYVFYVIIFDQTFTTAPLL